MHVSSLKAHLELSEDNDARRAATITKQHPRVKFSIRKVKTYGTM